MPRAMQLPILGRASARLVHINGAGVALPLARLSLRSTRSRHASGCLVACSTSRLDDRGAIAEAAFGLPDRLVSLRFLAEPAQSAAPGGRRPVQAS
jgi:hypothetical protein